MSVYAPLKFKRVNESNVNSQAYVNNITATEIYQRFAHKMAAETARKIASLASSSSNESKAPYHNKLFLLRLPELV